MNKFTLSFALSYSIYTVCLLENSCVSLPQNTPEECQNKRYLDLQKERKIYTLTKPSTTISTAENAMTTPDIKDSLACPLLNLTTKQVVGLAATDPNQQQWLQLFIYISKRYETFTNLHLENPHIYENVSDFIDLYEKALEFQVSAICLNTLTHYKHLSRSIISFYSAANYNN